MALGEEPTGEVDVFRRDPHPLAAPGIEGCGDIFEIGHGLHVDPGLGHRDHDIGRAEPEFGQQRDLGVGGFQRLADEVFAGDPHVGLARCQQADDFAGGNEGDFHAFDAFERAAIIARAAALRELEPGATEEGERVFL